MARLECSTHCPGVIPVDSVYIVIMIVLVQGYRGQGIAGNCVSAIIEKRPKDLFPVFCFIESSNESSKKLFHKLGFMKSSDVVWTGIENR